MKQKLLIILAIFLSFYNSGRASIVYVDSANLMGTQDGTSWANAYYSFQYGIDYANPGDTIWVAKGTYYPALNASFTLKEGVVIYGGFQNVHTSFSQRNVSANATILHANGDNYIINNRDNNLTSATVLDGFTLTKANTRYQGGAMSNRNSSPTILNCTFIDNRMGEANSAGGGGGIFNANSSPYIYNCKFLNNYLSLPGSTNGGGAAIANYNSSPIIENCEFNNNELRAYASYSGYGGAIYSSNSHLTLINSKFTNNKTAEAGGAIYCKNGSSLTIQDCVFSGNTLGAIYLYGYTTISIKGSTFYQHPRGAIQAYNGTSIQIDSTVAYGNVWSGFLIANNNNGTLPTLTVKHSEFYNNRSGSGGVIQFNGNGLIDSCEFRNNSAGSAGAVSLKGNNMQIRNCSFLNNYAEAGGALSGGNVFKCTFIKNKGLYQGGAIESAITIDSCTFTENTTEGVGGAISVGAVSISNCSFTQNGCVGTSQPERQGGAIHFSNYMGAAMFYPRVKNCTFIDNYSQNGGAVSAGPMTGPRIQSSSFQNNTASGNGGAIFGLIDTLYDNTFVNNSATVNGGALFLDTYNDGVVNKCFFSKNQADTGGAIYHKGLLNQSASSNYNYSFINCVFSKNKATVRGGGLYNHMPPKKVINTTFSGNIASLGAPVYNTNTSVYTDSTFSNCIIWGNSNGVYNQNTNVSPFSNSLVQGLGGFPAKKIIAGTTDPLFVDTLNENYALLQGSPCINYGKNSMLPAGITIDFVNQPRIFDGIVDLGAYEFNNTTPLSSGTLTFTAKAVKSYAELKWTTIAIDGIQHFEILRSNDNGVSWSGISRVQGRDEAMTASDYSYSDLKPLAGVNLYQLRYTLNTGERFYSDVRKVTFDHLEKVVLYPNPAEDKIKISGLPQRAQISILNLNGQVVKQINDGVSDEYMDIADLAAGAYFIVIQHSDFKSVPVKFIKK